MDPYYEDKQTTLYLADAFEVLPELEAFDALVTDPPYASGTRSEAKKSSSGSMLRGKHLGSRLAEPIALDQMTTTGFLFLIRQIALAAYPLLPEGGSFLSFIDWRQWPSLIGALETVNFRIQSMIVWDKGKFGLGNGFRNQHELIVHASKGVPEVYNRSTANVIGARPLRAADIGHPSPKPPDLLAKLIDVVAPEGGVVFDPFAGSGATLLGAASSGRRSIGCEIREDYCEIAAQRLGQQVLAL